uniref:LAGLIDADG endonuclease n=1 Tax=Clavaria fumosa TaxID=264083 RepID=A0A7T3U4Y1_9AGAR|nr:LAGLIDADG endonuclease [Clavaria fumosa]QPZ51160.1 LAGLIDADG endonuclease [Clavaria fumosa]
MVRSQKIDENQMGNRGSKSDITPKSVKEQRVDGSLWIKPIHIRYTLTGFERNYRIKILSKQLKLLNFSTLNTKPKLNPWFVTGLIDAEGSFTIFIYRSNTYKLGWGFQSKFQVNLHIREISLLLQLQEYFGGIGSILKSKTRNEVIYSVSSINYLKTIIIPHFFLIWIINSKSCRFYFFYKNIRNCEQKKSIFLLRDCIKFLILKSQWT